MCDLFRAKILVIILGAVVTVTCSQLEEAFIKENIVPEIIDCVPKSLLEVFYETLAVNLGNELTPLQAKRIPNKVVWDAKPHKFYLLAMFDSDAPKDEREYKHWLVGNIPGEDLKKGQILAEYASPTPPQGTGFHRYIFLVYEQPSKLTFNLSTAANRTKFHIRRFVKKYNLGDPVAGNFFLSHFVAANC